MAPRTASNMPFSVSPSFMLETSMATMGVLVEFGFSFVSLVEGLKCCWCFGVGGWVVVGVVLVC